MTAYTFRLHVLEVSVSLCMQPVAFAFVTAQIKEIFQRHRMTSIHLRTAEIPAIQMSVR